MTSFIVISQDKTKRQNYVQEYCTKLQINNFDITIVEKETSVKQNTQSISIDDVKLMQKKIFLKPIKSKTKAVILEDSHLLTTEAQNALLKVLEEPPDHTIIVLATNTKEALLPTIISRCKLIYLEEEPLLVSTEETAQLVAFITSFSTLTVGDKLKKAEQLAKDKEKAIEWFGKILLVLRERLLKKLQLGTKAPVEIQLLKSFQTVYTLLKTTNVNPRFAIEHAFISL